MPIQVLADEVASQIAAGEVVERPASVVKELTENALDAGARVIEVSIRDAGKQLIEVSDDGSGIAGAEINLAVARHATSKLSLADDLFNIRTLGFRGEALASIASVSEFTLTSHRLDEASGREIRILGGKLVGETAKGSPQGTLVRVENLFHNVPARLKFLKSNAAERQQIDALVMRYALAYPEVRFTLRHDGRTVLQTSGDGDRRAVLASIYGPEVARQLVEVEFGMEGEKLSGFISPPSLTRSNRRDIIFFVNGRWVQNVPLTTALLQAYHTLLMVGRYPLAALFVEIPPPEVDVNVHPAKSEVRFRNQDKVFSMVQRAARRALLAHSPVAGMEVGPVWTQPINWQSGQPQRPGLDWTMAGEALPEGVAAGGEGEDEAEVGLEARGMAQAQLPGNRIPLLRLLGQIGAAYLVAEGPDGLYLIDQHAAHERVLFERLMEQGEKKLAQALLEPVIAQFPPSQMNLLRQELQTLRNSGFDVEEFGTNTVRVRAIPADLSGADPVLLLRAVVEDFEEDETPLQAEREARIIARVCKRSAVRSGQVLTPLEQKNLLESLEQCISPRTCPHGRPTMIHLPVGLLERQFGRRGAR